MVVVNSQDEELGIQDRRACHSGAGILHRAISVFLFDSGGRVLVQRRHSRKALWGGFWSNTCCTHPRPGEAATTAATRRLSEEFGVNASLSFAFKFEYHARFDAHWSEWELCSVFVGRSDDDPVPDPDEVESHRWMSAEELDALFASGEGFTPWFRMEWDLLKREHAELISRNP